MKKLFGITLSFILLLGLNVAQADVVVIVSAKSGVNKLTKDQVSDVFMGKVATYPDGSLAVPVDQVEGAAQRDEFHSKVTGKTGAQIRAYWSRLVFSGKASPPKEVANAADVKKLIAANPNMIGYIDKATVDESVKTVFVP